jgi:environmental stress-induced protein Ves
MKTPLLPYIVPLAEAKQQMWRNGGGMTRELLTRNQPGSIDWQYRISVAQVNVDGPFSHFESTQRHFCVLSGSGVALTVDGALHRMTENSDAFSFSGEAQVECSLIDGPTSDLNFMVRTTSQPESLSGMIPIESGKSQDLSNMFSAGVFTLQDCLCQWQLNGQTFELPIGHNHLVWFDVSPQQITCTVNHSAIGAIDQGKVKIAWSMYVKRKDQQD